MPCAHQLEDDEVCDQCLPIERAAAVMRRGQAVFPKFALPCGEDLSLGGPQPHWHDGLPESVRLEMQGAISLYLLHVVGFCKEQLAGRFDRRPALLQVRLAAANYAAVNLRVRLLECLRRVPADTLPPADNPETEESPPC